MPRSWPTVRLVFAARRSTSVSDVALHHETAHVAIHEVVLVLRGCYAAEVGGETVMAHPGDVVYYAPGERHAPRRSGADPLETINVDWTGGDGARRYPRRCHDTNGRLRMLGQWMADLRKAGGATATLEDLLAVFLHALTEAAAVQEDALVATVRAYVAAHLDADIPVAALARAAGMSTAHFARRFAEAAGEPPAAFVRRLRMIEAQRLLAIPGLSVADVAGAVGFRQPAHFARVFRQHTGEAPAAWRGRRGTAS